MVNFQVLKAEKLQNVMVISVVSSQSEPSGQYQLVSQLDDLLKETEWDTTVKVLVLAGNTGEFFLEGWEFAETGSKDKLRLHGRLVNTTEPITRMDRPVVAAISGDAIGQGLELALACDIRIATDTSHFGFPHIKEGLIPWDGGTQRLSRVIGQAKAMEMILTGEVIDANEARRIGLVSKVVSSEELMPVTMDMAQEMASKGPVALRYAKEAIHKGMDLTLEQGLRLEADLYFLLHTTKDRTEGIKAFREKRTPEFEGR